MGAVRHQFVIGRMKLNLIAAEAARIIGFQLRRILIGNAAALGHRRRAPMPAEIGKLRFGRFSAIHRNGFRERAVEREQIDILERRRLVEDFGRGGEKV